MVKCLATNCTFNNSGICNASVINMEGFDANITPETYCKTFINNSNQSTISNSLHNPEASSKNIICGASNCMYNFNGACKSSEVQVNSLNNTCETFIQRDYSHYEY